MKQVSPDGNFWMEQIEPGVIAIGVTPEYKKKMGVIWTFIPSNKKTVVQGKPFANIESSRCLAPLRAPVNGVVKEWNDMLFNTPDKLDHNTYIVKVQL